MKEQMKEQMKEFAFVECPTRFDTERAFILSGVRIPTKEGHHEFAVRLKLDERSKMLIGLDEILVSEKDFITDELSESERSMIEYKPVFVEGLKITPYLTHADLKDFDEKELRLVFKTARENRDCLVFPDKWRQIEQWASELLPPEPDPPPVCTEKSEQLHLSF